MTSTRSEDFVQFQPRHHSNVPRQLPESQLPFHVNPQTRRLLTAADFSRRHPRQSDLPGLVIYNDLPTFDFAVSPLTSGPVSKSGISNYIMQGEHVKAIAECLIAKGA